MKYKVVESPKHKNFIAVPINKKFIDYGTVIFDSFEDAESMAIELAIEKYPEIWGDEFEKEK